MASRYSRSEKEKWASDPRKQPRRPPVLIHAADSNTLIEANKFTLIGRVTNPNIQKTRALVDFFLQNWSVVGQFTERELGPHLFQFTFESERDLQTILKKSPFHIKRWMMILQIWEPIVSDDFPSSISFWIRVHGIPLHYWTEGTLHAIGSEIGVADTKDVKQGRVRVHVNGLKPLEMVHDITLPSRETKKVELEYEKLEKHCFLCKSLTHEKEECPQQPTRGERDQRLETLTTPERWRALTLIGEQRMIRIWTSTNIVTTPLVSLKFSLVNKDETAMRITETLDKELPIDQPHREEAITEMNLEAPLEIIEEPPQHLVVVLTKMIVGAKRWALGMKFLI